MSTILLFLFIIALFIAATLRFTPGIYYFFGTAIFHFLIRLSSPVYGKTRKMVSGRKRLINNIITNFNFPSSKKIWIHCASLGEFEQGRTLIEKIKKEFPDCRIILTFYSPSGYELRKDYAFADYVTYMPFDSRRNARAFINAVRPDLAIFVKYEFWLYHLAELKKQNIPFFLISAIFSKKQIFFRWFGTQFRNSLRSYTHIFVQDPASVDLLAKFKITNASVAFDTRFDRVIEHAAVARELPLIDEFTKGFNVIVAGSTWPRDERILRWLIYKDVLFFNFKLIVAPHNIDKRSMKKTMKKFKKYSIKYSEINTISHEAFINKRILILDNIGMLSSVYKYGEISYIGGGFNAGIHNTLEAAVYGRMLMFGPKYKKFKEAADLVEIGSAFPIRSDTDLFQKINYLNEFNIVLKGGSADAAKYVADHAGGTETIMQTIRRYF